MDVEQQIKDYITSQPQSKRADMETIQSLMLSVLPKGKLWFDDGKDSGGKVVSNPSIGFGSRTTTYADGKTRDYYQIGMSANTSGISIYILGIEDKTYLVRTFGGALGKASVSGYCIKFKKLQDIDINTLEAAIRYGVTATS